MMTGRKVRSTNVKHTNVSGSIAKAKDEAQHDWKCTFSIEKNEGKVQIGKQSKD